MHPLAITENSEWGDTLRIMHPGMKLKTDIKTVYWSKLWEMWMLQSNSGGDDEPGQEMSYIASNNANHTPLSKCISHIGVLEPQYLLI